MGMLPPVFVELRASIGEFSAKMGEARAELSSVEAKSTSTFAKTAAIGKGALLGLGAVAVGVGVMSIKMADEFEESHVKLEQAIKNTGQNFEELSPHIDAVSKRMENLGFTNAETEGALANLTTALGSPKKAMTDMGLAADLARYKHIDLASAALLVAKASEGQLRPLKALGIDLPIAAGGAKAVAQAHTQLATATQKLHTFTTIHADAVNKNSKQHGVYLQMLDKVHAAQDKVKASTGASKTIIEELSKRIGGQASAASETFGGKVHHLAVQADDLFKNIGMKLVPILINMIDKMQALGKFIAANKKPFEVLGAVIGTYLVGAIGAYITTLIQSTIVSSKAFVTDLINTIKWTAFKIQYYSVVGAAAIASAATTAAAWIAANAAMILATGGIIIAIGLLIAAGVYLKNHWQEITTKVKEVFAKVSDWIKSHSKIIMIALIAITGPIGLLVAAGIYLKNHWQEIMEKVKEAIAGAANWIHDKVQTIKDAFTNVFNGLAGIVHSAFSSVGSIIKGYFNIWIGIVDFIVQKLNGVIDKANSIKVHIPGMGSIGVSIPHIPEIPHLANGGIVSSPTVALIGEAGPEAVVPLSKGRGFGGSVHVTVNVHGSVIKEKDLAVSVRDNIGILMRRQGLNPNILGV